MEDIARIVAKLVMEGKLSVDLKFLDSENSGGVLRLLRGNQWLKIQTPKQQNS